VPLMQLVSKSKPFNWTSVHKEAYKEVKWVISKETLLSFPDFNKPFHVYTNASNYQLGNVIMQDDKPLAFYSHRLNPAQKRYTTGEQELLSIVETLKEFCTLLYGQRVVVHTDHKNILYGNLVNNQIARW
jgi:RNase H-like domain found in reverse transcriptase